MSINVTVNGNPICVRRSRMVLSDLEQIKKNERDRRKRLRLEQVRQQSREISGKLLERAKNLAKTELGKLERDNQSELRKMHERKIAEIQRKYQEDMEDIGLAHTAAAMQPDANAIIEVDRQKNRVAAAERGKEAAQRLKEAATKEDSLALQQERLQQVREVENIRSSMVAKLSSKIHPPKDIQQEFPESSSHGEKIIVEKIIQEPTPKKKKSRKLLSKKSPAKVLSKSNIKVVPHKSKSPRHIIEIHRASSKSPKNVTARKKNNVDAESAKAKNICKSSSISIETECPNIECNPDLDYQEPRQPVPTIPLTSTKAHKVARYNPDDYKPNTSDSNGSSSSSVSDDSSYFSDGGVEFILPKTTPEHHTSMAGNSKVQLYDHCTRQRTAYDQPLGLVERLNIRNEPNAEETARQVLQSESVSSSLLENRRQAAARRGNDALLRERVRRDYETMMKNLDHLTREERKLKASQKVCCTNEPIGPTRRKEIQNDRQRRMDRAFENVLRNTTQSDKQEDPAERVITIPARSESKRATSFPASTWQDPPFSERTHSPDDLRQDSHDEMSREEHILEMLQKVERQKRLLLREFGADLPNKIFSASMTPLFDSRRPQTAPETSAPNVPQVTPSPEIKVINMSTSDENSKKSQTIKKKVTRKLKSPPPQSKMIETAVQTFRLDEIGAAKDKSTQVEFITEDNRSMSAKDDTGASLPLEYIEPRVTIITPEVYDTSSSSDSPVTGIVIEVDKNQVKVTPSKSRRNSDKMTKRSCSRPRSKPRSLPASTAGSPIKKATTSAPSSRSGSPKKVEVGSSTRLPEKTVDFRIRKISRKVQPTASRPVVSSIESSSTQSTPIAEENIVGKPYRIFKQPTLKRVRATRETSDTSTSYASLPAAKAASQIVRNQITPILEMLDSSANESARGSRKNVSPVSTPDTPSPRIINVPSNMPNPDRIGRILRYDSFTNGRADDSTLPSSTQNDHSNSTDPSFSQHETTTRQSGKSSGYCSCANPTCELLHNNINDIREYARTRKYDDVQNLCTERIASLTELIKMVRNEQQGFDFSLTNPADETSLMQLPPPLPYKNDLHSVQRLVDSIEAIHSQLAKTLKESQKIITSGVAQTVVNTRATVSSSNENRSKSSSSTSTENTPVPVEIKAKPKIVANERVQIDLQSLKRGLGTYTAMVVANEAQWPTPGTPRRHEEVVAKLYQEILEQSHTVDQSKENVDANGSLSRQRTPSPPSHLGAQRRHVSPSQRTENEVTRDERQASEKVEEFVPFLAGIPKAPSALPILEPGTRPRPPSSAAYRSDMVSPRHELSTIVEFDTPDTVNRSQGSARSPTGKTRRLLQLPSPSKSASVGSSNEKNAKTQTLPVRALISENMARDVPRRIPVGEASSPAEKFVSLNFPLALSDKGTTMSLLSQAPRAVLNDVNAQREEAAKFTDWLEGNKAERDGHESRTLSCVTPGERHDENGTLVLKAQNQEISNDVKEKFTSTSSNSFSVLSGISEIVSTPSSELVKWASSSEEIETALKKMGLGWAVVTLKKTREASALSSSSNSDVTPMNTARRTKSPGKKQGISDCNVYVLPDFSDVSSISIKEASKSTERAVLMKARTSTPNIQISNSTTEKSSSTTNSSSVISMQDHSDSLTAPNISLNNKR